MENWKQRYADKIITTEEAVRQIKNGDRVYLGSMMSEPGAVIDAMATSNLDDVEIIQFISGCKANDLLSSASRRFRVKSFSIGGRACELATPIEADYVPLFHSQIPDFFRNRRIAIDVAVVQVSEPDSRGKFSLGISVDVALSAVESARKVIAQVNPAMPRTCGDSTIDADRIHYLVEGPEELFEAPQETLGVREKAISRFCSELIEDGAIVQFGFAGISQGLMEYLKDRRDLGLHTEILTDPLIDLIEAGIVTNATKKLYRGKSLATCCMGTRRLYDFIHENPDIELYPSDILLNPSFIGANERMVAVNLAVQVDLRGQIRQGSPTWTAFEGSGGDHDFMRGASISHGGRSIICLRSTSMRSGNSTIVPSFGPKSAVIMNRGDVNYIVTEFGVAYLGGKSIRDRAMALIDIAHPDHREDLLKKAREMGYLYPDHMYYRNVSPDLRQRVRTDHVFKGGLKGHIRCIKPTDESMLRDLFYHMSESSVYFRYFSPRRSMPHANLQQYCNVGEDQGLSLVVTIGPRETRRIVAEGRYMIEGTEPHAEVAFMVAEGFQGRGLATYLLNYMTEIAKERGFKGLKADVLISNTPMCKVFDRVPYKTRKRIEDGIMTYKWDFDQLKEPQPEETK